MVSFYSFPVGLFFSCGLSLFITSMLWILILKHKQKRAILILFIFQISLVIFLVIFVVVGGKLQAAIALPHIQQALDRSCQVDHVSANEEGFFVDSGFHWQSFDETALCYFNNVEWICTC